MTEPPETTTEPPAFQICGSAQSLGSAEPENSAWTVGFRITSPPAMSATAVSLPGVPALKSATVVSVTVSGGGSTVVNVQLSSLPSSLPAASVTFPETVTS